MAERIGGGKSKSSIVTIVENSSETQKSKGVPLVNPAIENPEKKKKKSCC